MLGGTVQTQFSNKYFYFFIFDFWEDPSFSFFLDHQCPSSFWPLAKFAVRSYFGKSKTFAGHGGAHQRCLIKFLRLSQLSVRHLFTGPRDDRLTNLIPRSSHSQDQGPSKDSDHLKEGSNYNFQMSGCPVDLVFTQNDQQLVVSYTELVVLVASLAAVRLHVDGAQAFSTEAQFHAAHVLFCVIYVAYHLILRYYPDKICQCDPLNFLFPIELGVYALMMGLFIRYWKKAITAPGVADERWRFRIVIYAGLYVVDFAWYVAGIAQSPCRVELFDQVRYVEALGVIVIWVDLIILAFGTTSQLRKKCAFDPWTNEATSQALMFISLPVLLFVAGISAFLTSLGVKNSDYEQIFGFLLPSIVTLALMWRRNYIGIGERWTQPELELDWVMQNRALDSQTGRDSLTILGNRGQGVSDAICFDIEDSADLGSELHKELKYTFPLESHIQLQAGVKDGASQVSSLDNSNHAAAGRSLRVEETLQAVNSTATVVKSFLAQVILPSFERSFALHQERTAALVKFLEPTSGASGAGLGDLETGRKQHEIEDRCKELSKTYADFLSIMRVEASELPAVSAERLKARGTPFKTSAAKKSKILAHVATNLMLHSTTLHSESAPKSAERVASITFGAPAAHSLGFGSGGLHMLREKLDKMIEASRNQKRSPERTFQQLHTRFMVKARESVVFSQALAALVASSIEQITSIVVEKRSKELRQLHEAGLLVHSVSLLSTHGKEEGMIDDFRAAYDDLEVRLSLVASSEGGGGDLIRVSSVKPTPGSSSVLQSDLEDSFHGSIGFRPSGLGSRGGSLLGDIGSLSEPGAGRGGGRSVGVGSLTEVKVERDQAAQRSTSGKVTVTLAVQAQSFLWVAKELGLTADVPMIIDVFPVLFNLGVNEMQTVANSTGSVAIQTEINKKGVKLLRWYHSMFLNTGSNLSGPGSLIPIAGSETIPHLLDMLEKYVDVEAKEKSKMSRYC